MTGAMLVHRSDDVLLLTLANNPLRCSEALQSERFGVPPDDISFDVKLDRRLRADGTFAYVLNHVDLQDFPDPPVTIKGDVDKAPEIALKFSADARSDVPHWKHIDVEGTVAPTVCGTPPVPPDHPAVAKAAHPSSAKVTVAGQTVAIVSAVSRDGSIYLSTEPATCSLSGIAPRLSMMYVSDHWQVEGGWFGAGLFGGTGIKATAGAHGDSADGKTVALTLSGSATFDAFRVELSGTIEALDCPKS